MSLAIALHVLSAVVWVGGICESGVRVNPP